MNKLEALLTLIFVVILIVIVVSTVNYVIIHVLAISVDNVLTVVEKLSNLP